MKKIIYLSVLALALSGTQVFAAHRPPMMHPMMHYHRPHHHYMRPMPPHMYSRTYYYSTPRYSTYTYYTYETPVVPTTQTVVIRENNYEGINTAANIINAAANVAATIKFLSW